MRIPVFMNKAYTLYMNNIWYHIWLEIVINMNTVPGNKVIFFMCERVKGILSQEDKVYETVCYTSSIKKHLYN